MQKFAAKKFIAIVKKTLWANARDILLEFELVNPKIIEFYSGQFISLKAGNNIYRSYSICSDSAVRNRISIVANAAHHGVGSNYIRSLKVNDDVEFIGPSGKFVLSTFSSPELVFVCTGTGISPIVSMLARLLEEECKSRIRLFFGIRHVNHMLFFDRLQEFKSKFFDFDYKICVSSEEVRNGFVKGRVTDYIEVFNIPLAEVYLCGHPDMISEMKAKLLNMGVSESRIFHEAFFVNKRTYS